MWSQPWKHSPNHQLLTTYTMVSYQRVKLHCLVSSCTILILSGILSNPEMYVIIQRLRVKKANILWRSTRSDSYISFRFFVRVQDNVGIAVVKLSVVLLRPVCHLMRLTLPNDCHQSTTAIPNIYTITLNFTILQICSPTLVPAPFQAGSVSADAFFTCGKHIQSKMATCGLHKSRTFRSTSLPNSAMLLSFQSYFFAFCMTIALTEIKVLAGEKVSADTWWTRPLECCEIPHGN